MSWSRVYDGFQGWTPEFVPLKGFRNMALIYPLYKPILSPRFP